MALLKSINVLEIMDDEYVLPQRFFFHSPERALVLLPIFVQWLILVKAVSPLLRFLWVFMLQYHMCILANGNCWNRLMENCYQDKDPVSVWLSRFPWLSLRSVLFSIIHILTLSERHRPIESPSGGVACGLYFYESSSRVFTVSAWLHVPDCTNSLSAAFIKRNGN